VLYRFLFAAIGFAPATWRGLRNPATRIARQDYNLIFIAALVGVPVQFLIQFAGLARTTVSHASLMIGALPVLLAAGSALFAHEHVSKGRWLALVASMIGAGLIAFGASSGEAGAQASLSGDLLVAVSLFAGVAWILITQVLMNTGRYSPVNASAYVMTAGALMVAVWAIGTEGLPPIHLTARTWAWGGGGGRRGAPPPPPPLATTLTTYLWNWGLARVPASQAGVFLNFEPVVGAILGVLLLHDVLGHYSIIGGLLVIGSAIYVAAK
jgi:drug/metabolite transporter (DMT)-like permease